MAKLPEPARGIRAAELAEAMRDAKILEESLALGSSPAHANGSGTTAGSELGDAF